MSLRAALIVATCSFFLEPEFFSQAFLRVYSCDVSILHGIYIAWAALCVFFASGGIYIAGLCGLRCDLHTLECIACLCGLR